MKGQAFTVIGLYLTDIYSLKPYSWPQWRLLRRWLHGEKRLADLLSTVVASTILGAIYFVGLTLFLRQLAEHGW
jgi:hypothetical protein